MRLRIKVRTVALLAIGYYIGKTYDVGVVVDVEKKGERNA